MSDPNMYSRVVDTLVGHGKLYDHGQFLCEVVYKILVEQEVIKTAGNPSQEVEGQYRLSGDVMHCRLPMDRELELEMEEGRRVKIKTVSESQFVGNEPYYQKKDSD